MRGLKASVRAAVEQTRNGFTSLRGSPRDLYIVFVLKVLESFNYFSLSRLFTLYLTEEFGISDYRAGFFYGLWGTLLTAYGFLLGGMIDFLGVKTSLVICFLLNIGSRLVMASTTSRVMLLVMLLGPNTIAGALGVPVMTIGVKRYTHEGNRGFAFALFYSLMNCAALSQGVLMDVFRIGFKHGFNIPSLPERSLLNSGSRLFLATGCLTSLVGLVVSFTLSEKATNPVPPKRTSSDVVDSSVHSQRTTSSTAELELPISPEVPLLGGGGGSSKDSAAGGHAARHRQHGGGGSGDVLGSSVPAEDEAVGAGAGVGAGSPPSAAALRRQQRQQRSAEFWAGVVAVLSSRGFYKYLLMCLFTVNLKSVFRHLDATLPKYQLRAFGCNFPIGLVYSINPAMIVLLVPIVGAMTTDLQHFDMIHIGGWISAVSPFFIVAFNSEWSTAAFVALLSLGEAIWSPRWYDYSMGVAPEGREGIFTALASAPLFAAMLPTGMISGALLQAYCPDNGQCGDRPQPEDGGGGSSSAAAAGRRLLALLSGRGASRSGSTSGSSGGSSSSSSQGGGLGGVLHGLAGSAAAAAAGITAAAGSAGAGAGAGSDPGLFGSPEEGPEPGPGEGVAYSCDGRSLWLVVGVITLSSPLLVLLTQRWLRPGPRDFARVDAQRVKAATTEGEFFDVNEADPMGLLENVYESSLLHQQSDPHQDSRAAAMEGGGAAGPGGSRPGSAGGAPRSSSG